MEPEQGAVLRLHGELDDEALSAVRRQLAPRLAEGLRHVLLDLTHVTSLPRPAVRLLEGLDAHLRSRQGGLLLIHANADVRRTLRINDLWHLLEVRDLEPPTVAPARPAPAPAAAPGVIPLRRPVRVAGK